MKIIFIYLVVVLVIAIYIWVNILKEGNQTSELTSVHNLINGNGNTTQQFARNGNALTDKDTNILTSNAVSPGISSIDRYSDPMCKPGEYIYCLDGQIECNNIFGDKMNVLSVEPNKAYMSGNTLRGCSSYIDRTNLIDYSTKIGNDIAKGVFFDLSNCKTPGKSWRAGGTGPFKIQGCYTTQSEAETVWNGLLNTSLNEKATYNVNDQVFVLDSFLKSQTITGLPAILAALDNIKSGGQNAFTTINGQKYYYSTIKAITGTTYSVTITNTPTNIVVPNVPKSALLKDSLYNPKTNDYYSNLKSDSYPRPVCKSGAFTSCLSSPPFTIQNSIYVPTKDATLNVEDSYNKHTTQSLIDFNLNTPFSAPPINPSGIVDNAGSLLEYNHFSSQPTDATPFIKCSANYGTKVGDPLCCDQPGTLVDTKGVCPQEVPTCRGYSMENNVYGYCGQ